MKSEAQILRVKPARGRADWRVLIPTGKKDVAGNWMFIASAPYISKISAVKAMREFNAKMKG